MEKKDTKNNLTPWIKQSIERINERDFRSSFYSIKQSIKEARQ